MIDTTRYPMIETFFVGGVGEDVTGSQTLLKIIGADGNVHFGMVDCGALQGDDEYKNYFYPVNGKNIEFVLITHAHYDHVGDLPMLYNSGFRGRIYTTSVAKQLIYPLLIDAAHIQENASIDNTTRRMYQQASKKIKGQMHGDHSHKEQRELDAALSQFDETEYKPLYTVEDIEALTELFRTVDSEKWFSVCTGVKVRFIPTTHQNGAVRIEICAYDVTDSTKKYTLAFSGDIGPRNSLLYQEPTYCRDFGVDSLVLETLHGTEEPVETLDDSIKFLYKIVSKGIKQHKHIILAGFSLDRNAMLVYLMNNFKKREPKLKLFIDSPLTMKQLKNYQATYASGDKRWFKKLGPNPFDSNDFTIIDNGRVHMDSALHGEAPRVIITSSANGGGGRITDYYLNGIQRDDYIFVVNGWVRPDSPTGILLAANQGDVVEINGFKHKKHCTTYQLHGFSSHGYFGEIKEHVNSYPNLNTLILNHARGDARLAVRSKISEMRPELDIMMPELYDAYKLTKAGVEVLSDHDCLLEFDAVLDIRQLMSGE